MSISLYPGKNSLLKGMKEEKTLLSLLLVSMIDPLTFSYCLGVKCSSGNQWKLLSEYLNSIINLIMWFEYNNCVLNWNWPPSFCRCKWIKMRPTMASIPSNGKVEKVPRIHVATLHCIFLSSLRGYAKGAFL